MWQTRVPRRSCAFTCIPFQHKGFFGLSGSAPEARNELVELSGILRSSINTAFSYGDITHTYYICRYLLYVTCTSSLNYIFPSYFLHGCPKSCGEYFRGRLQKANKLVRLSVMWQKVRGHGVNSKSLKDFEFALHHIDGTPFLRISLPDCEKRFARMDRHH